MAHPPGTYLIPVFFTVQFLEVIKDYVGHAILNKRDRFRRCFDSFVVFGCDMFEQAFRRECGVGLVDDL